MAADQEKATVLVSNLANVNHYFVMIFATCAIAYRCLFKDFRRRIFPSPMNLWMVFAAFEESTFRSYELG